MQNKRSLKIVSLILAIVMAISIMPLAALAKARGETRKVGIVVYGSELTAILTNVETSIKEGKASIENGDAEAAASTMKNSLDTLIELATSFTTGAIDGTGFSVPDLNIQIKDSAGKTYSIKEQPVEIFSQTAVVDLPFEDDLDEALDQVEEQLAELEGILEDWEPIEPSIDVIHVNDKIHDLSKTMSEFDFVKIADEVSKLTNQLVGKLAELSGLEGKLYRTYVLDDELTVGETYEAYITGFTDTDDNNNLVTRDGYIVFNDGLDVGQSMFDTTRRFTFDVRARGRFEHEIQFVGPAAGITGTLELGEDVEKAYDSIVTVINSMTKVLKDTQSWISEGSVAKAVRDLLDKLLDAGALIDWFNDLTIPELKTSENIDKGYEFSFPGLWCAESDAGFTFTNVDVAENGIAGANFLLVNRDEVVDVLKMMIDLGKEVFSAVMKTTFGYTDEESGEKYEGMLSLYAQLIKSEDGQISLDYDVAYDIIKSYIAVISQMDLLDKVIDTNTGDILTPIKLKNPIPAILMATADENGKVTFSKNSNKTLTWMLKIIPEITEALGDTSIVKDNDILSLLMKVYKYAEDIIATYGDKMINTLVYPFAQRLGLVGQKMGSGTYIMFQIKATDSYLINPLAYTMNVEWDNDGWAYATVADLGIIAPYFAEGFYEFVRTTTFAGTIDSFLNKIVGKDVNVVTGVLTDEIDITREFGRVLTAALTTFIGQVGFNSLGLDKIFTSKSDFITGLNDYLYKNGRTAQNLMIYVNQQAMKAKAVYTGYVDENWYFYNLDKSPTATATKLISKSADDIAACFAENKPQQADAISKTGNAISQTVNKVGTAVETAVKNAASKVASTVGSAVKTAAQSVVKSAVSAVKNIASNLFSKLFNRSAIQLPYNA